jgi:hypothetical protein
LRGSGSGFVRWGLEPVSREAGESKAELQDSSLKARMRKSREDLVRVLMKSVTTEASVVGCAGKSRLSPKLLAPKERSDSKLSEMFNSAEVEGYENANRQSGITCGVRRRRF